MGDGEKWPDMRVKHLEMIQVIVVRMNGCSQQCKVAALAIFSALIGLATTEANPQVALTAVSLVVLFAFLDAYYLMLERSFCSKFDFVRKAELSEAPDLELAPIQDLSIWSALTSSSVLVFYLVMISVAVAVYLFINEVILPTP